MEAIYGVLIFPLGYTVGFLKSYPLIFQNSTLWGLFLPLIVFLVTLKLPPRNKYLIIFFLFATAMAFCAIMCSKFYPFFEDRFLKICVFSILGSFLFLTAWAFKKSIFSR